MNLQDSKVGNIGDILKHAALVALGQLIKKRNAQKRICYLDTHTYNFKSKCSNERWSEEVAELVERHGAAYASYRDIENEAMTKGHYLCSSALAVSTLQNPELFLAEKDAATHASLASQIEDAGLACAAFKYDSIEYRDLETPCPCGPLFALVDPFKLSTDQWRELWKTVCGVVDLIHHAEKDGLILVFHYSNDGTPAWQEPPSGFAGIVGMIEKPPFYLAVYATEGIADEAQKVLKNLGWDIGDSPAPNGNNTDCRDVACTDVSLSGDIIYLGIDLAWGTSNDSGIAYWCPGWEQAKVELFRPVSGNKDATAEKLLNRIKTIVGSTANAIVAIDAPLKCPPDVMIRDWENYIGSVSTDIDKYRGNVSSSLVALLERSDYHDLLVNVADNVDKIKRGISFGHKYVEVFPNPTVTALAGKKIKYKQNRRNPKPLDTLVEKLREAIDMLMSRSLPFAFDLRCTDITSEKQRKQIEDQFDSLICLSVAVLISYNKIIERVIPNGGLYAIGGVDDSIDNGAIVTPLSQEQLNEYNIPNELLFVISGNTSAYSTRECPQIISSFDPTNEQKNIIECDASIVRVIARAGTGKTTTMVHRAARIIEQDPNAHVLMLTFTRNAADSMRDKYVAIKRNADKRFEASTFHGFALKCLLDYGRKISIGGGLDIDLGKVSLLNEFGRQSVMDFYKRGKGEIHDLKQGWEDKLSNAINGQYDLASRTPFTLLDGCGNLPKGVSASVVWKELLSLYARESLVDFDVIMVLFEYLLRTDAQFLRKSRGKITHAIIDEFQDTNYPQLSSVEHLTGYGKETQVPKAVQVMVVGDDFQIIYDWRGAVSGIFDRFASWGDCVTLPLHESFRSSDPVLTLVNKTAHILSKHPDHQVLCEQVPAELVAGKIVEGSAYAADQGADELKDLISLLRSHGEDDSRISILSFKNDTARNSYDILCAAGIPCDLVTARPSEIPGVRRFLAFLTIWIKPSRLDFGSWWYLNTSYVGMKSADFEDLWAHVVAGQPHDANTRTIASLFGGDYEEAVFKLLTEERLSCVNEEMLLRMVSVLSNHDSIIKNDKVPCERIARLLAAHEDFRQQPLRVIGEMTRRDFAGNAEVNRTGVQISTIHQYKGLENDAVIVFYDFRPDEAIDKMRLEYVARSRAKKYLVLCK